MTKKHSFKYEELINCANGKLFGPGTPVNETIEYIKSILYPDIEPQQGIIWYYKDSSHGTLFGHNGGDIGSTTELFISLSDEINVEEVTSSNCVRL